MGHLNVEIKARCADPVRVLERLRELGARSQGVDEQTDVYYRVPRGRLKLRRGLIENNLVQYDRADAAAPRESRVRLVPLEPDRALDEALDAALKRDVVVRKTRHILWIGPVKFHLDEVDGLGSYVEIEAIDRDGTHGAEHLHAECSRFMSLLGIADADLEPRSYSDLLRGR